MGEDGEMEEVKVWKEVLQQQQLSTNEVPGSHYKPLPTETAGGRPSRVCVCVCVRLCVLHQCFYVCVHVG